MFRYTDFEIAKERTQEFYAEAERNRQIRIGKLSNPAERTRWFIWLLNIITTRITGWRCLLQARLPQSLFPIFHNLALAPDSCICVPEPCAE